MNDLEPRNNLSWRVTVLEREVQGLKDGKPEVIAERVRALAEDVHELRDALRKFEEKFDEDVAGIRRLVMGAFATIATGLAVAIVVQNSGAL